MLNKCGLSSPTIKRFFIAFAMAFASLLVCMPSDAATVLRLDEGGLPKPAPKPHREAPREPEQARSEPSLHDLPFVDAKGKPHTLAEFKGKLVLVNLWATWCAPCVKEMPDLSQIAREYESKGLVVVTISQDTDPQKVKDFFSEHRIDNLPLYFDPGMRLFQSLGARGLPVTLMMDPEGKEITRFNGFVEWLESDTRKMLDANLPKNEPRL